MLHAGAAPIEIADDTFLISDRFMAGRGQEIMANSLIIRGAETLIVDTGAPVNRDRWLKQVFSLARPTDINWVFISHNDPDHTGGLSLILELCPQARVIKTDGPTFDATDRRLRFFLPPVFDAPGSRGVIDERTGVLWAVDAFAALTPGPLDRLGGPWGDGFDRSFRALHHLLSPWLQWAHPGSFDRHVDAIESLSPTVVASAHGPVLKGLDIHDAFDRIRELAGTPPPLKTTRKQKRSRIRKGIAR